MGIKGERRRRRRSEMEMEIRISEEYEMEKGRKFGARLGGFGGSLVGGRGNWFGGRRYLAEIKVVVSKGDKKFLGRQARLGVVSKERASLTGG